MLATRSPTSDGPSGDPRPVAMFAVAPSEPEPNRYHIQDAGSPHGEAGITLWKSLEGSA